MKPLTTPPVIERFRRLTAGLFLVLVLGACVPETVHPLSDVEEAKADQRLAGPWFAHIDGEDVHAQVIPQADGWTAIVTVYYRKSGESGNWMVFRMVPARVDGNDYMSVQFVAPEDEGEKQTTYDPLRYRLAPDGVVKVWRMSDARAMVAIEGGLPGSIKKLSWTNRILVTATTAQWAAFLRNSDPDQLFPAKIGSFRRLSPPAQ
jgi:hypothetical protein